MGDAISSDISTVPITQKSPEENSVIRPNRKKVRIQRSQSDNVGKGTAGPSHECIPECLTLPQKNKNNRGKTKNNLGKTKQSREAEKVVDSSCSGSFKDVIREVYWMQCTNCDH